MKVAIIGLGKQNLDDHIPALLRRKDVEIVAVSDPAENSYNAFKAKFPDLSSKVNYLSDYHNLATNVIDFCVVSVPHDQYFEICSFLCSKDIPFMKEKPLARNLDEAKELTNVNGFEKNAFVCTQRRYSSLYKEAKELIATIGTPYLFNAVYKLNIEDPAEGWRGNVDIAGGGCVLDMGYHIIDQLVWWFGKPKYIKAVTTALANSERANNYAEDTASIIFKYDNGLVGTITLSRSAGEKAEYYSLHGSDGHIFGNKKSLILKNKKAEIIKDVQKDNTDEMLDSQLEYFLAQLTSGNGFKLVQDENMKNMELIDSIYRSQE